MDTIVIMTEANECVATGHLMEAIGLADALTEDNKEVVLLLNDDCSDNLRRRIKCKYEGYTYKKDLSLPTESIIEKLLRYNPGMFITDMREVSNAFVRDIRKFYSGKIVCIDEWGHRRLDADVIINPMIDSYYWTYPDSKAEIYAGAEYLILPRSLQKYRGKKTVNENVGRICVSMGGVDIKGTTLKLTEWIPDILPDIKLELILGAGFPYCRELEDIIQKNMATREYEVCRDVKDIYEHFLKADIVFCAGGNTLHELACLGVPTIVIPTMPHEERNGKCFESIGFGLCLSLADIVEVDEITEKLRLLISQKERKKMSACGKQHFQGNGIEKTMRLIMGMAG